MGLQISYFSDCFSDVSLCAIEILLASSRRVAAVLDLRNSVPIYFEILNTVPIYVHFLSFALFRLIFWHQFLVMVFR
jgi:hypothetical protein